MASRRKNLATVVSMIVITILLLVVQGLQAGTWFDDETLAVWIFDVGQGDAIFIDAPNLQILVDGGPSDRVLEKLSAVLPPWDNTLDVVIATHPDADHITGLSSVLEKYDVGELVQNGVVHDTPVAIAFEDARDDDVIAQPGMTWDLGQGATLEVVYPADLYAGRIADNTNAWSIVLLLTYGETTILLTGDSEVEQEALYAGELPHIDVLKVGHHGSPTSTGDLLVNTITPDYGVLSVGADNSYGHPNPFVVDRLQAASSAILRTDEDGDVRVTSAGGEPAVHLFDL